MKLQQYTVEVPDSTENTMWIVHADSPVAAAGRYVEAYRNDEISIDGEEFANCANLRVMTLPEAGTKAGVVDWDMIRDSHIALDAIPEYADAVRQGWIPEDNAWNTQDDVPGI